jgi:parvulin-like peptidyl-prolyl isomerase
MSYPRRNCCFSSPGAAWMAILVVYVAIAVVVPVHGQDDFGDDADGGGDIVDMESMMGSDRKESSSKHKLV